MSSPTNLLERYFKAYNARDTDAIGRLVTDAVTLSRPGQAAAGRDELLEAYRLDWVVYPDCRLDVKHSGSHGDRVFAELTFSGTNTGPLHMPDGTVAPPTGRALALECAAVGDVEAGVLTALRVYWDNAVSMQQLGLMPG